MLFQELTVNLYRLIFDAFWTYRTVELWIVEQIPGAGRDKLEAQDTNGISHTYV
jgi:hypothetical protein